MKTLTNDCFAVGGAMIRTEEALARLAERLHPVEEVEDVPLAEAVGRVLAADLTARLNVPPHANSAVDGYAVFLDDLSPDAETRLPVGGRVPAGGHLGRAARPGEAIRIFTGAPMPAGPDTVLMQEDCRLEGDTVVIPPRGAKGPKRGANVRAAGEDVTAGATILEAGIVLRPQDVGLAASVGYAALPVRRRLRVAVFSTGDEVRDPDGSLGASLEAGQVFDSNRYTLLALLREGGYRTTDLGILPDRPDAIRAALDRAAADHDVILTSGGVSMGEEDHVKGAVQALGDLHFWRIAIKPGRPVAMGHVRGRPFIGLPGNPVAVMVTYMIFARAALLRLAGVRDTEPRAFPVRAAFTYGKKADRREWLRGRLERTPDGGLEVRPFPRDGSGILTSMVWADGLIVLPEETTAVAPGDPVAFLPFREVFR